MSARRIVGRVAAVVRRVLIAVLMVLILVRPGWGEVAVRAQGTDLDVLVVVDRTTSMDARDGPGGGPRLDLVRQDLKALAADLPGARFAAMTFGGQVVRLELPYTTDTTAFDAMVDTIQAEGPYDGVGSRLDAPYDDMKKVLSDDADQHGDRRRVVVLASDGENTAPGTQRSFAPLAHYVGGGAVLGYGTEAGGKMPLDGHDPRTGYIFDETTGDDAVSRIDVDNLQKVAGELGVGFLHRTTPSAGTVADLARSFKAARTDSGSGAHHKREITWTLGLALLPLLLWELYGHRRTARAVRRMMR